MRTTLAVALAIALIGASASAGPLNVGIDSSAKYAIPAGARNVMVGNPSIADVSLVDGNQMVVLGRNYGSTNVLVIDARGRTLYDGRILVSPPEIGQVAMVKSGIQSNYSCSPRCERVAMPGEPQTPYTDYAIGYKDYSGRMAEGQQSGAGASR